MDEYGLIIEAEHLTKRFKVDDGFLTAVDDVTLPLYHGLTYGIVGESGCGKSTLVRMLMHLEKPSKGRVLLHGQDIFELRGENFDSLVMSCRWYFKTPWGHSRPR